MPSKTLETFPQRVPLEARKAEIAAQVGVTAKNTFAIRRGAVVGQITSDGLYRERTRAAVTGTAFAANSPTGTVDDASIFVAGDVLKNAAGVAVGTIQSIAANTITLTGNAAVAVATGANVFGSDGSQATKGISDSVSDGVGDTQIDVFVCGLLDESLCLRLDATAKTELGGASVAGGIFKF